jgi:hypothetical protein
MHTNHNALRLIDPCMFSFLELLSLLVAGGLLEAWLGLGSFAGPFAFTPQYVSPGILAKP